MYLCNLNELFDDMSTLSSIFNRADHCANPKPDLE